VWALGEDRERFAARAPGREQIVTGLERSQRAADRLAERIKRQRCAKSALTALPERWTEE
jgi:hypothetical protein